mmetsp:Transcript_147039/g.472173  ORF Transcript_147039/g.472173 Transcript_147039/m.472173 type:complete len:117 (+) Transcript_147039:601-951(+)
MPAASAVPAVSPPPRFRLRRWLSSSSKEAAVPERRGHRQGMPILQQEEWQQQQQHRQFHLQCRPQRFSRRLHPAFCRRLVEVWQGLHQFPKLHVQPSQRQRCRRRQRLQQIHLPGQ